MSRFKTKSKQALTVILALLLFFAMVPSSLPGGLAYAADNSVSYLELYTDASATQTTNEYSIDDLAIYVRANSAEEGTYWPWFGIYKGKMTTEDYSGISMVWAYAANTDGSQTITYNTDTAYNVLEEGHYYKDANTNLNFEPGDYTIILFRHWNDYGPVAYKQFTIKDSSLPPVDFTITTDKTEYSASEPIIVTTQSSGSSAWVGLYEGTKTKTDTFDDSYIGYYYCKDTNDGVANLTEKIKMNGDDGNYTVALFSSGYNVEAVANFYAETPKLSFNKEGNPARYKYGESVLASAKSGNPGAWVGIFEVTGADFPDPSYGRFDVDGSSENVDILKVVSDAGKSLEYGKQYRLYLTQPIGSNPTDWVRTVKFELLETYLDTDSSIDWSLSEDKTKATAVFHRADDNTKTAEMTTTDLSEPAVTEPTCAATGLEQITASLAFDDENSLVTVNDRTEFTHTFETVLDKVPHTWGDWTVVTPATEEAEGLERRECSVCHETEDHAIPKLDHVHSQNLTLVPAVEATCETEGNEAYYVCTCDKMFSDENAENEITAIPTIPAKGHDPKEAWVFDAENHKHYHECTRCDAHLNETDCTFDDGVVSEGTRTYTCSVCGGTYTESTGLPYFTTTKTSYAYGEPILATAHFNGYAVQPTDPWAGIYREAPYQDSVAWYYDWGDNAEINLLDTSEFGKGRQDSGDAWESGYVADEYILGFFTGDKPYTLVGEPTTFTVYYEYNAPTDADWTWADDYSSATATFKANNKPEETETLTDSDPSVETTPATCTEDGSKIHTATVTVPEDAFVLYGNPESRTYTISVTETLEATGHTWGDWTTVTPATETEQGEETRECSVCHTTETRAIPVLSHTHGLTPHPATPATCVADGNTAYWVCDQGDNPCGKYFDDAEGTHEIEPNSWIIPKTNEHDYGDWVFDGADKKTHTKTCSRDASHKVTESCTFVDSEPVNGKITHTCSVCGGSYTTDVLLSTDKDTYKITDPIMVTLNYEGDGSAWVGLYGKNETPNAEANPRSIYWYNVKEKDGTYNKTYDLTKGTKNRDYGPGEYKVILFGDGGFTNILDTKYITITDKEPSTLMIDKAAPAEYTMGDPIMVTATSDYPDAWVGLYDYNYSEPLDTTLLSWYNLSDSNGEPVDIWNGDIVEDKEKLEGLPSGKYKVILFSSGYNIDTGADGNLLIRSFDLKDNSGCEHNWGKWIPDEDADTHTRECSICHMKETKPCTYTHAPSSDPGVELFTCTECKRQYEKTTVPVITLNKENGEYELGEDILVTTELNGVKDGINDGWIALQYKGESYDNKSLLWYYPSHFDNPKLLQSVLTTSNPNEENVNGERGTDAWTEIPVGEYELVFLDANYKKVGEPTYFTVVKGVESEKVTKEPTCTEKGIKHIVYKDGTEEDVKIDALGHDPKTEWVHDAEKRTHYHECSRCGERINETACTFDEGKVTKEPTATEEGEMLYTCTVCKGTYTEPIPTLANQGVKRVYGDTRYQTSLLQANELKEYLKLEKFDNIIVATGTNYADALSGSYLGYVKAAPIILVRNSDKAVVADVKDYIKKNLKPGGTVYLLGGEAVVTGDVTKGLDVKTERLSGPTRYETNIEILKAAGVGDKAIMVCDGTGFADSLSASAAKLPILLVKRGLNDVQRKYLDTLNGNDFYLIGGTGVLPKALEDEIGSNYGAVERLGGADRYETSTKVAEKLFKHPDKAVVAYAMNYPDGLCGGTLAAYMDAPLLLVRDDKTAVTVNYAKKAGVKSGMVLGGSTLVSDKSVRDIFQMSEKDEIYVVNKMTPMTK